MGFPSSPINNQQVVVNGIRYYYNQTLTAWIRLPTGDYVASTSPPTTPDDGAFWYNTSNDILYQYLDDGVSSYWVDVQSLGQTGNIVQIDDSTLSGNITVGVDSRYSIGASNGYLQNVFVNNITANNISMNGNIVPSANITYDLGSTTLRWKDLFLSGNTIDLGGATIKTDTSGAIALIPQPTVSNPDPTGIVISPTGSITTVTTTGGTVSGNILANATASTSVSVGKSIAMAMVFGG
jgi:hypothetical protein